MLNDLHTHLASIYRANTGYDVADFLITDPRLATILGQDPLVSNTEEAVLVAQDDGELELSVFMDEKLLARLAGCDPLHHLQADQLNDLWQVLEGISHFNYIAWSAARDRQVTLLELEMQAEVDKYFAIWLLALSQRGCGFAHRLHGWLFDEVSFKAQLDDVQQERYRAANDLAARFCHGLRRRMQRDRRAGMRELRRFYRLSQGGKISHIRTQAYACCS
ncbi:MAG: hypothetical protein BMS9Abin32_240 [Gammaproteobacteria bacterium]|nr:MAG: hypothetical protein BMS9Abin32_240 [Gammaproteobacteria bacterium]